MLLFLGLLCLASAGNVDLETITLSAGTLNPAFSSATLSYTATVDSISTITVSAFVFDGNANVGINEAAGPTTVSSKSVGLSDGSNTITINVVNNVGGANSATFVITVTATNTGAAPSPSPSPAPGPAGEFDPSNYQNVVLFDEETNFQMFWRVDGGEITIQLEADVGGWMAIAVSPDGGMNTGGINDVHVAWTDAGACAAGCVVDATVSSYSTPTADAQQDLVLLGGQTIGGRMYVKFKRTLTIADANNLDIAAGSTSFIYAVRTNNAPNDLTLSGMLQHNGAHAPQTIDISSTVCTSACAVGASCLANSACTSGTCLSGACANCPNNCNGQGTCEVSGCRCDSGFTGADCLTANTNQIIGEYDFTVDLADNVKLSWKLLDGDTNLEMKIAARTSGWVAVGFNPSGSTKMTNADIIAGSFSGTALVRDQKAAGTSQPSNDDVDNVKASSVTVVNGETILVFLRALDTGDSAGDNVLSAEDNTIIWAYGDTMSLSNKHSTKGSSSINLKTGSAEEETSANAALRLTHGILMTTAWIVCTTAGVLVARYFHAHNWWFKVHVALQMVAVLFTIVAFILALIFGDLPNMPAANLTHAIFGFIIVLSSIAQSVIGVLADKMWNPDRAGPPLFPDKIHWWLGRFTYLLAIVTVIMGWVINDMIGGAIFAALVFLISICLHVFKEVTKEKDH